MPTTDYKSLKYVNPFAKYCVHMPHCTCVEESRERWLTLMVLLYREPKKEIRLRREEVAIIDPSKWAIEQESTFDGHVVYRLLPKPIDVTVVEKERKLLT